MSKYVDGPTLRKACVGLPGTSGTFMFCWFALKAKGLTVENPVVIGTTNTTEGLKRLWSWGEPTGRLLFPLSLTTGDNKALKMVAAERETTIATIIHEWIQERLEEASE